MTEISHSQPSRSPWPASLPIYYGWVNVLIASVAMTATLPGRTHGLGLITEPLLTDFQLDRVTFAQINLTATLIGAAFCLPVGRLIDRLGVRRVLVGVTFTLAISVLWMSACRDRVSLVVSLVLIRGLGQSALSVVSMAAIGKWFRGRLGIAMGVFAVLLTFGFIASVLVMGQAVQAFGWRVAWQGLGWSIVAFVPFFALLARSTPESIGVSPDPAAREPVHPTNPACEFSLRDALRSPAFWAITLGGSVFNLVWSGVTLFNESMLAEHQLSPQFAVQVLAILTGVGLLGNLVSGPLATRSGVLRLMGIGLLLLAAGLATFPLMGGTSGARLYAIAMGLSGGIITVVFFAAWGHLFGRRHLGLIQGAAQFATVLGSALGPLVIAWSRDALGAYWPMMAALSVCAALLGIFALFTSPPNVAVTRPG